MADIGLLIISAIVGSFLGVGFLIFSVYIWYLWSKRSTHHGKQFDYNKQFEQRRFSIPDPSPSFDVDQVDRDFLEPLIPSRVASTSPSQASLQNDEDMEQGTPQLYLCIKSMEAERKDDLILSKGDLVQISMTFTDGWAHGINTTTKRSGMFLLSHIQIPSGETEENDETPLSASSDLKMPPIAPEGEGKLLYSMINVDDAMEIVTTSFSSDRRKQYFDDLLKNSEPNVSSSISSIPSSTTSDSRASRNWSRLRNGWRDAVKGELKSSFDLWEIQRRRSNFWKMLSENYTLPPPNTNN